MNEHLTQWGRNVRNGRRLAGYSTQLSFAEALGVTQGTVARWEAGLTAPRDEHKASIAALCGQEVRAMFPLFAAMPKRNRRQIRVAQ